MQKLMPKQNVRLLSRKTARHVLSHLPNQRVMGTPLGALAPWVRMALSTGDGDQSVSSQSSSSVSSQVPMAGSESEGPDRHGSATFVSLLKSGVNSPATQSTDSRQPNGSPKKSALEGSSVAVSQSISEVLNVIQNN